MKLRAKVASVVAAMAVIAAVVAIAAVAGTEPATAQSDPKAVTAVYLGHNSAFHLTFYWHEPERGIPRDYRVMWAKASENYKTWTDESGNAFVTTNSHQYMDAERGVEYKAKVRARWQDGTSGPWSPEARYTIPLPPTPTPTPTPTPEPTEPPPPPDPHWESSTMPNRVAMFDWTDVDDAIGYELEMDQGSYGWANLLDPSRERGYNAWILGSSAIIGSPDTHTVHLRVRGLLPDDEATDWYYYSVEPR